MSAQHTQTDWETDGLTVKAPPGFFCETRMTLATLNPFLPAPERMANARLMAAAPSLLAELQWALQALESHGFTQQVGTARAAIAKATGGEL